MRQGKTKILEKKGEKGEREYNTKKSWEKNQTKSKTINLGYTTMKSEGEKTRRNREIVIIGRVTWLKVKEKDKKVTIERDIKGTKMDTHTRERDKKTEKVD